MKRVLIVNTIGMGYEGISSVIVNYLSHICSSDIQFDIIAYNHTPLEFKNKLENYGNVYIIPKKKINLKGYLNGLKDIIKKNKYDVIHVHGNSGMMLMEALLAKRYKIPKIIIHCHNTTCDHKILNAFLKFPMKVLATDLIACSVQSGKWLYGHSKYEVLNNAINYEMFKFNEQIRKKVREELNIKDKFALGHIGSFIEQKNHDFLIDIFYEFQKEHSDCVLLLVSDGPKFKDIKDKVKNLNIEDKVIFAGRNENVNIFYQVMDVYLMPSKWEGLPLVMIEAQACSLPVIASDTITNDAKCTSNVTYLPINNGIKCWLEVLERMYTKKINRNEDMYDEIKRHGFDINTEADKLRDIYID